VLAGNEEEEGHTEHLHYYSHRRANTSNDFPPDFADVYSIQPNVSDEHGQNAPRSGSGDYRNNHHHHHNNYYIQVKDLETKHCIGKGACASVFAALHKPTNKPLALKVISIHDRNKRKQLLQEVHMLYEAKPHPCLIKFYGAYYKDGYITMILELMNIGCLSSILSSFKNQNDEIMAKCGEKSKHKVRSSSVSSLLCYSVETQESYEKPHVHHSVEENKNNCERRTNYEKRD